MRGSDCDGQIGIARVVDGEHHAAAGGAPVGGKRAVARVAGGNNHHYTRSNKPVDFRAEGALTAGEPRGVELITDAEIAAVNADVAAVIVDSMNTVNGRDNAADIALAIVVEDLHTDQPACRRDAFDGPERFGERLDFTAITEARAFGERCRRVGREPAGDDPGDVRAVAEAIRQGTCAAGEIVMGERRIEIQCPVALKVEMIGIDAGVDDRPDYISAVGGDGAVGGVGLYGADGPVDQGPQRVVVPDAPDGKTTRQRQGVSLLPALGMPVVIFGNTGDFGGHQARPKIAAAKRIESDETPDELNSLIDAKIIIVVRFDHDAEGAIFICGVADYGIERFFDDGARQFPADLFSSAHFHFSRRYSATHDGRDDLIFGLSALFTAVKTREYL